jgi:uncharacterized protein YwqG
MPLYSKEELKQLPEFQDLGEALHGPEQVFRLRLYRQEGATEVARVGELRNLQELSISLTDVSELLPRLGQLQDLQSVYLQACKIRSFPEAFFELAHLRWLAMGNNSLTELPGEIGRLRSLEYLNLSQNELRRIPESMGVLDELKTLCLSYNALEMLPDEIGNLPRLEWLFLDVNRLTCLPSSIGRLKCLEGLAVNHNRLATLPESVCGLVKLNSLSLEHNPLESLPRCLAKMGIEKISIEAAKRSLFMDWTYQHSQKPPRTELADMRLFVEADSALYAPLMATIQQCALADLSAVIAATAREAIEMETTVPDDYSRRGSSRLGGFPDLVDAGLFPKTDDLFWCFLAQINLAEIAHLNHYLPRAGLLSFFVESTERLNGRVVFYEGEFEKLTTIRYQSADEMVIPDDDYSRAPHRVKFQRRFSIPHRRLDRPESIEDILGYQQWEPLRKNTAHQINGYTYTQHEMPQELAADQLGGQWDEWVPLLQLGWDDKVGFCFWDAGTITFTIHQEDLRRHDFSRVHVSLESS